MQQTLGTSTIQAFLATLVALAVAEAASSATLPGIGLVTFLSVTLVAATGEITDGETMVSGVLSIVVIGTSWVFVGSATL